MHSKLIVLALLCMAVIGTVTSDGVIEYYWREYNGEIPIDAFPGGVDKAGNLTYIGQLYTKEYAQLMPVTIVKGSNIAFGSTHQKVINSDKDVKILCSVEQHRFKWITTKVGESLLLTNDCPLVNAGRQADDAIYIGRANYQGETIIGRAFINPESVFLNTLWIPYNGKEVRLTPPYEMLTFDCMKYFYIAN